MFRQELLAEAELAGEEIETPEPSEAGDDNDDVDDDHEHNNDYDDDC